MCLRRPEDDLLLRNRCLKALSVALVAGIPLVPVAVPAAFARPDLSPIVWSQFQGEPGHTGAASQGPAAAYARRWKFRAPQGRVGLSGAVIAGDTAIAVGAQAVYGLDLETGSERWTLVRDGGPISMPAVGDVQGKRILAFTDRAGDGTTSLVAVGITGKSRTLLWRQPLKAGSDSGVTIDQGQVFVADNEGAIYGFDLLQGDPLWDAVQAGGRIDAPLAAGQGRVYAVSRDTSSGAVQILGVDVATGKRDWTFRPPARSLSVSAPALVDGVLYVVGPDQMVYALGAERGNTLDSFRIGAGVSPLSAPAVSGGAVFVADVGGGVYGLGLRASRRLWDYQLNELQLRSSPVVVGDAVVLGLDDGRMVAIDVRSGHLVWQSNVGPGAVGPIAVAGDRLVAGIGGADGGLVGLAHDATRALTDLASPSELDLATTLSSFAIAVLGVSIAILGAVRLLALRFRLEPLGVGVEEQATEVRDEEGRSE